MVSTLLKSLLSETYSNHCFGQCVHSLLFVFVYVHVFICVFSFDATRLIPIRCYCFCGCCFRVIVACSGVVELLSLRPAAAPGVLGSVVMH